MHFLFLLFMGHSLASDTTSLVGWQLEGNSRSTWDIVWACFSTIFACTWTVLHLDVPQRNLSDSRYTFRKILSWVLSTLVPELWFWIATIQLYDALVLKRISNEAQKRRDDESQEPRFWLSKRAKSLGEIHDPEHITLHRVNTQWTLHQCFCIVAGGLAFQTQDEWIYTIRPQDMKQFIHAGIIHCRDFRDRDVKDRAKADSFAKAFTVLQSTWFLCSMIARWASSLPVSPIELATVAYVFCGVLIYGVCWYKPKDMTTAITLYLPYNRDNIPVEVRSLMESHSTGWVHLRACIKEENWASVLWRFIRLRGPNSRNPQPSHEAEDDDFIQPPLDGIIWSTICDTAALLYCAVHIAA